MAKLTEKNADTINYEREVTLKKKNQAESKEMTSLNADVLAGGILS